MLAESTALSNPGPSPQQQIVGFGRIPGASESHIKLNISCGEPVAKLCLRRRTSSVTMSLAMLHVSVVTGKRRMLSTLYGIARFSKRFGGKLNTTEAISLAILQVSEIFHFHEHPILQKFQPLLLGPFGISGMHLGQVTLLPLTLQFLWIPLIVFRSSNQFRLFTPMVRFAGLPPTPPQK